MMKRYFAALGLALVCLALTVSSVGCANTETTVDAPQETVEATVKNVTVTEAYDLITSDPDIVILDVRTPEEFDAVHIEGAINIDFYDPGYVDEIRKLDNDAPYLVYCRSGSRSAQFSQTMITEGFTDVTNMLGGMNDWTSREYPVAE